MPHITSPQDVKKLGSILSVWAHPDDETFSCAGLMALAIANGQNVACITATKGEAGVQDEKRWPPDQLGDIRTKELYDALQIIGVHHHHWLDYHDGHCAEVDPVRAARQIASYIDLYRPDTILTFGPEGMTGHPDHQTVSSWVDKALTFAEHKPTVYHAVQLRELYEKYLKTADSKLDIFFNIDKPPLVEPGDCDVCVKLTDQACLKKCQALAAMPSQTEGMVKLFGDDALKKAFAKEAFVKAKPAK